jgi:hypothetical protein
MVTIEIPAKLTIDDLFKAVEQLPPQELIKFTRRVIALQAKQGHSLLIDEEEQALLAALERPWPPELQSRLDMLRAESRQRPLIPARLSCYSLSNRLSSKTCGGSRLWLNWPENGAFRSQL